MVGVIWRARPGAHPQRGRMSVEADIERKASEPDQLVRVKKLALWCDPALCSSGFGTLRRSQRFVGLAVGNSWCCKYSGHFNVDVLIVM